MSKVSLLDVNFLLALFDPDHVFHEIAHDWFAENVQQGWATCPLTENGFLRLAARPARRFVRPGAHTRTEALSQSIKRLATFRASGHHHYWPDEVSLTDSTLFRSDLITSNDQLTDIYLLGLATKRGGQLVTFDQRIPISVVIGASSETLQVLAPSD